MTAWGLSMAGCEAVISAAVRVALEATRGPVTYLEIGVAGGATRTAALMTASQPAMLSPQAVMRASAPG